MVAGIFGEYYDYDYYKLFSFCSANSLVHMLGILLFSEHPLKYKCTYITICILNNFGNSAFCMFEMYFFNLFFLIFLLLLDELANGGTCCSLEGVM